jgi:hypothetical protein
MMTTNDFSGRGRRNAEGRWNQNILAIEWRRRWHCRRLVGSPLDRRWPTSFAGGGMRLRNAVVLRQCQQRGDVVVEFQEGLQPVF